MINILKGMVVGIMLLAIIMLGVIVVYHDKVHTEEQMEQELYDLSKEEVVWYLSNQRERPMTRDIIEQYPAQFLCSNYHISPLNFKDFEYCVISFERGDVYYGA